MNKEKRLKWALSVSLAIFILEVVGGVLSNSLALLSDAGHVLTDAFAITLSLVAAIIARKPSDFRATYGYHRIGLLAAVINGISLLGIAVYIFIESYERFFVPPVINAEMLIYVAFGGLIGNVIMAMILSKDHHDLNIKSAWLHIMGDLLASVGVLISGIIIIFTGFTYADPIASLIVGVLVLFGGLKVVKESLHIFLELTPSEYNIKEITDKISSVNGVKGLHDVHLWSISYGAPAFSAHILISDIPVREADEIRKNIEKLLSEVKIKHTVLQLECDECEDNKLYCRIREHAGCHGHEH